MKRMALSVVLCTALLVAMGIAAVLVWAVPYEQIALYIDGEPVDITPLSAGHWLALTIGLLIAVVVVLLVVPLAVAFGLGLPLLVAGVVLALLASPLLLAGWIGWRLWKRPAPKTQSPA